jgi:hypothetical protein
MAAPRARALEGRACGQELARLAAHEHSTAVETILWAHMLLHDPPAVATPQPKDQTCVSRPAADRAIRGMKARRALAGGVVGPALAPAQPGEGAGDTEAGSAVAGCRRRRSTCSRAWVP